MRRRRHKQAEQSLLARLNQVEREHRNAQALAVKLRDQVEALKAALTEAVGKIEALEAACSFERGRADRTEHTLDLIRNLLGEAAEPLSPARRVHTSARSERGAVEQG